MATRGVALGSFDMFHVGHLRALRRAAHLCDHLVIAVADDALVEARCGAAPLVPVDHRVEVVGAFGLAAEIVVVDSDSAPSLIESLAVEFAFVAGDDVAPAGASEGSTFPLRVIDVESTVSDSLLRVADQTLLWIPADALDPAMCR